jgi:hypothetical protein
MKNSKSETLAGWIVVAGLLLGSLAGACGGEAEPGAPAPAAAVGNMPPGGGSSQSAPAPAASTHPHSSAAPEDAPIGTHCNDTGTCL